MKYILKISKTIDKQYDSLNQLHVYLTEILRIIIIAIALFELIMLSDIHDMMNLVIHQHMSSSNLLHAVSMCKALPNGLDKGAST